MNRTWIASGLTKSQRNALIWSLAAFVACAAMNIYHYSLEGAKGLYLWNRTGLFRFLIVMGLIPGGMTLVSFPLEKLKADIWSRIARGAAIAASVLVILASLGFLGKLIIEPRIGTIDPPKLTLVIPKNGISPVAASSPGFQAGGTVAAPGNAGSPVETVGASMGEPSREEAPLLRLSFSSDPHWGAASADSSARNDILAGIAERRPDAFFMLGDTVEDGSKSMLWNYAVSDLEAFIPRVPLVSLLGNHDALFGGQYLYRKAFVAPGFKSDSGSPYYYSIDAKAAKIVVLDLPWGTEEYGAKQRQWLEKTLREAGKTRPIIVVSHSYFYASGYVDPVYRKPWFDHYQDIPEITPLFEQYGVALVVSGHNHYQEYLEHSGVRYAIIGTMGGVSDPEPTYVSPASKWIAVGVFGRLDVDVTGGEVILRFLDNAGNTLHEERFGY